VGTVGVGSVIVMASSKDSAVAEDDDTMMNSRCSNRRYAPREKLAETCVMRRPTPRRYCNAFHDPHCRHRRAPHAAAIGNEVLLLAKEAPVGAAAVWAIQPIGAQMLFEPGHTDRIISSMIARWLNMSLSRRTALYR
jgi:hypothetical protein